MIAIGEEWKHETLCLIWDRAEFGTCDGRVWSSARGLVWGKKHTYCAAAVRVYDRQYRIATLGLHGLTDVERESLETYLESLDLKKMEGRGNDIP